MQKINRDLTVTIEELDALAEVLIPAMELNDIRRERDEYLSQTASDLYDRVVYMVRSAQMPEGDDPKLTLQLMMDERSVVGTVWLPTRRARQEWLKKTINELFERLMRDE